jgi:hypothetical protein
MTTLKFKRSQAPNYLKGMSQCLNLPGQKFSYALVKNMRKIDTILEGNASYHKNFKVEGEQEYHAKRIELCKQLAEKDEQGNPRIENNQYVLPEDRTEFNAEFEKIKEEFKKTVISLEQREEEFKTYLDEEIEIDIHPVKEEFLPETISGEQRLFLEFMIDESPVLRLV